MQLLCVKTRQASEVECAPFSAIDKVSHCNCTDICSKVLHCVLNACGAGMFTVCCVSFPRNERLEQNSFDFSDSNMSRERLKITAFV